MPHNDRPGIHAFLISAHSSSGDRLAATGSMQRCVVFSEPQDGTGTIMTALKRSTSASATSTCASARKTASAALLAVLTCAVSPRTRAHSDSEPRPVPCLWLRPCSGVRLPGGSAGDLTHWDLSARACRPLGPSCSRAHFLLLTRIVCVSSQIKCSCWSSSLTTNKESFGISSFTSTFLSYEARRANGAGWRGRA